MVRFVHVVRRSSMRTLRLVALSADGKSLVLALDGEGADPDERFELPIDDRLRAAARGGASTAPRAPSPRRTPRRWTSRRAPAWCASSPTCPAASRPTPRTAPAR